MLSKSVSVLMLQQSLVYLFTCSLAFKEYILMLNEQRLPPCIIHVLTRGGGTDQIQRISHWQPQTPTFFLLCFFIYLFIVF